MHLKTGHKLCPRNDHSNTGRFGFRMVTVLPFDYGLKFEMPFNYLSGIGHLITGLEFEWPFDYRAGNP